MVTSFAYKRATTASFLKPKNKPGLSTFRVDVLTGYLLAAMLIHTTFASVVNEQEYIQKLEAMNKQLLDQVTQLTFELREMKRLLFGRKSERFIPEPSVTSSQLDLQLIMQEAVQPLALTEETRVITRVVPAKKPTGRLPLPAHLQREDIILEPVVDTKGLKKIGEEITEQLDYKPGKLIVKRFIRPKYAKVSADGTQYTEVFIAELPDFAIEKGMAAAGLLAQIIVDKQVDHLPIHRQIKRY